MAVAIVAHYLGPQLGIGQYLDRLVPPLVGELLGRGKKIVVLASPNAVEQTPSLRSVGAPLIVLPPLDFPAARRYFWFATRFSSYCQRHDIDSVGWLSNPLVLPWHPPSLAVIHDVNEWKNYSKGWLRTRLRSVVYLGSSLRFARIIVAVSRSTERDIRRFRPGKLTNSKLNTVVNGSDSALCNLPPVDIPAPDAPFLLSVGRIDPQGKCLPEAVTFVEMLRETSQEAWELHLVGGMNQSTEREGKAFLRSVAHLPWVLYHGHVDNRALAEWYRNASAVIFLAEHEGFGLPIAEATSFGRPVIINRLNSAGLEAGGGRAIAIDLQDWRAGVELFLRRSREDPSTDHQPVSLPTWRSAASEYARLLIELTQT